MSPDPLDAAIARTLTGDRDAYRHVVIGAGPTVRAIVVSILPSSDGIDDTIQETFLLAFSRLHDYRPGTNAVSWIGTIARNLALNERRRQLRERRRRHPASADIADQLTAPLMAMVEDAPSVEILRHCVEKLADTARAVVTAFYWKNEPAERIAAEHGHEPGWVRVVLHRSRASLAKCMQSGRTAP